MLSCTQVRDQFESLVTDELNTPELALCQEHLRNCSSCRQELHAEKEIRKLLGGLPELPCPKEVTASIIHTVDTEQHRRTNSRYWWLGAATLVAAGFALAFLLPKNDTIIPGNSTEPRFSQAQIDSAADEAKMALAAVARIINHNEKQVFKSVFARELPTAVEGSLYRITKNLQGEV